MIDIQLIRDNPELIKENNRKRGVVIDVDALLEVDKKRRALQTRRDALRAEQKKMSSVKPDKATIVKAKKIKKILVPIEKKLSRLEHILRDMLIQLPNILQPEVAEGGERDAQEIKKIGSPREFHFATQTHEAIGSRLGSIDIPRGSKVSGNRFWYSKGDAVLLEFALIKFVLDILVEKYGFTPMLPPHLVREDILFGAGFLPASKSEIYSVNPGEDDLFLIGTSEAPLVAYHKDEVVSVEKPLRYCAFTPCYRREAGAYGKDTTGILRGHQFDKIEMVSFTQPDASKKEHEFLLGAEEEIIHALDLPYRIVRLASRDLSLQASMCYDIEVFFPGQNAYREVTSCSNTTDFQARRLNIQCRTKGGVRFVHTLNGTAIAMGRIIAAIFENYQQEDGSVAVPKVIQPLLNKKVFAMV